MSVIEPRIAREKTGYWRRQSSTIDWPDASGLAEA
jgi:hypothetical protein